MVEQVAHCYLSPSGSTRKAGRKICALLEENGYTADEFDLSRCRNRMDEVYEGIRAASLLLIGSPVYANHAAGPVLALLGDLPEGAGKPALAYVTYGGVSKGSSLFEMAEALSGKGYSVLGLAEVLAVHSMMFRDVDPVGKGHPGEVDWRALASWIEKISPLLKPVGAAMDYSCTRPPGRLSRSLDTGVFTPRFMRHLWPSIRFRPEKCTMCGACTSVCPAGRLDDLPRIDEATSCLYCYQCVRCCPEGAFNAFMQVTHPAVRVLSRASNRRCGPETRYYT